MLKHSLFVRLEAKPGKEEEVAAFLAQGLQLANQETTTPLWFAERGGFEVADAPALFARFCRRVVERLGPLMHMATTFNTMIVQGRKSAAMIS